MTKKGDIDMLALRIIDIKDFMHKLLCTDTFDHFLLPEASIRTYADFSIDGHLHADFFDQADEGFQQLSECRIAPFSMLRPMCFSIIRGNHPPLSFRFVFQLSPDNQRRTILQSGTSFLPEDVTAMFLNLHYQGQELTCTTGISYASFTLDKSLEQEWERLIPVFLRSHQIPFEEL